MCSASNRVSRCNSPNWLRNSTSIINKPTGWVYLSRYSFNIINYQFVNVNVSKRFQTSKGVLILALRALGVIKISRHYQNYVHFYFCFNRRYKLYQIFTLIYIIVTASQKIHSRLRKPAQIFRINPIDIFFLSPPWVIVGI